MKKEKSEKRLNVFIPQEIHKELRRREGTLKSVVCTILTQSLHKDGQKMCKENNGYDKDLIGFFQQQVKDLQTKNKRLENKCEFYSIQSMSWLKRRRYNKQMTLLPVHRDENMRQNMSEKGKKINL